MLTPDLTSHHEHAGTRSWSFSNRAVLVSGSVVAILLIGALLRLYALGARGFWGDEIWNNPRPFSSTTSVIQDRCTSCWDMQP